MLGSRLIDADGAPAHAVWEAVDSVNDDLPAPTRASALEPGWVETHRVRTFRYDGQPPTQVRVRVHLRAMDLELLDGVIDRGYLDPAVRDRVPTWELAGAQVRWKKGDTPHTVCP